MHARELREQQVEARRLLESTHSALASDGDLLDDAERAEVDALVERLTALVISDDVEAVKAGIEALTKGTETLAERRMVRSIREALSGHECRRRDVRREARRRIQELLTIH